MKNILFVLTFLSDARKLTLPQQNVVMQLFPLHRSNEQTTERVSEDGGGGGVLTPLLQSNWITVNV
jgi:hypothetical protein